MDLCAWPWDAQFKPQSKGRTKSVKIKARGGWQASGVRLEPGATYAISSEGMWTIANSVSVDANGDASQRGRLVAATLNNYELSAPIDLGAEGQITATSTADLYLRCNDRWGGLGDNDGVMTVRIKAID